jgi:beta-N-acetylhexosaminidase
MRFILASHKYFSRSHFGTLARKIFPIFLIIAILIPSPLYQEAQAASVPLTPSEQAATQLDNLSPEERVGQLFLVTFNGMDTSPSTPIRDFITKYHIGGVILDRDNDNFTNPDQIPEDCWKLIQDLQTIEFNSSVLSEDDNQFGSDELSQYIPLFIGLSQEGALSPYSEILDGLSPIPSQMSIGATWDPTIAEEVGNQVGYELSSLGINLLLGPNLDVMSDPSPGLSDLGVRTFGGDPFWVGKFSQSYIRGIHNGSLNNIAVVAKYFPGLGSSDRLPENEVATVRKSLEQLTQIDLSPFFAVTGNAPDSESSADALLNSHIRYQGLQGNIRTTTRPISLDPQAFELLMELDPLSTWRDSGGIIVSDNLGSKALQNHYDPTGLTYNINRVAVDAFIAGNDILFLGNYGDANKPIPSNEIIDTIDLFVQKYTEDQDFADRVDASVLRILTLKNKLYYTFTLSNVLTSVHALASLGRDDVDELVARESATLVNPDITELGILLQSTPSSSDRLVILSDTDTTTICSTCPDFPTLSRDSLENAIIRLYGPYSGRQLSRANIHSYSFRDLTTLLDYPSSSAQMITNLRYANWIIIVTLNQNPARPYSAALTRLLSERQDLLSNKKIIVFAMGAPYYLDATNISKISAFIALYNHLPSSLDVAARILFNEFTTFPGNLPVSVPGINYDLITATSPDPDVEFPIYVGEIPKNDGESESLESSPAPPIFRPSDRVDLFTGLILDHNGNPVPDGTPVTFVVTVQGIANTLPQVTTVAGTAQTSFFVESSEDISVYAISSLARSQTVTISILGDSENSPTQEIPETPTKESPRPTPTSVDPDPSNSSFNSLITESSSLVLEWLYSLMIMFAIALIAYQIGSNSGIVLWGIRWFLSCLIGGLASYNYLILHLPGVDLIFHGGVTRTGLYVAVIVGSLFGWGITYLAQRISDNQ